MATRTRAAVALPLFLGAALTIVARTLTWHREGQTGHTYVPDALDVVVVAAAGLVAGGAVLVAAGVRRAPAGAVATLALMLACQLFAALLILGSGADTPTTGAWVAAGAIALLAAGGIALRRAPSVWRRLAIGAVVAVGVVAAVILPTDRPLQEIEVVR